MTSIPTLRRVCFPLRLVQPLTYLASNSQGFDLTCSAPISTIILLCYQSTFFRVFLCTADAFDEAFPFHQINASEKDMSNPNYRRLVAIRPTHDADFARLIGIPFVRASEDSDDLVSCAELEARV